MNLERLAARYENACESLDVDAWVPGMRRMSWAPMLWHHRHGSGRVPEPPPDRDCDGELAIPDFDDHAVIGHLYAIVLKVYADAQEVALITRTGRRPAVRITTSSATSFSHGETIAEALVLALEAAVSIRNAARRGGAR